MAVGGVWPELFRFFEVETVTARCARVDEASADLVAFFLFGISPPSLDFFRLFFDTEIVASACACDVVASAVSFTFFSIISLPSLELFRSFVAFVAANAEEPCVARYPKAVKTKMKIHPLYIHTNFM